jgi:hypothetical protein
VLYALKKSYRWATEGIFLVLPENTNDDLLALYTILGGIPKYIELFCDSDRLNVDGIIEFLVRENSFFIEVCKQKIPGV